MNKLAVSFCVLVSLVALVVAEAPIGMTISTTSVKIMPRRGTRGATAWTNGIALAQGQMVKNDSLFYMAEATIASATNEPLHSYGSTNDLRYVPSVQRKYCLIQNNSTNDMWINVNSPAELNKGTKLEPGVIMTFEDLQDSIHALAEVASSLIVGMDVSKK